MIQTRADLKNKITALEAENAELEKDLQESSSQVTQAQEDAKTAVEAKAGLEQKIEQLQSENETLKTKAEEAETAKADAEAKATPEAIQALVDASMAKAGVEPAEVIENSEHSETDDAAFKAKWADASVAEIFALKKSDPEAFNRLQSLTN